jgi:hypothetical protein
LALGFGCGLAGGNSLPLGTLAFNICLTLTFRHLARPRIYFLLLSQYLELLLPLLKLFLHLRPVFHILKTEVSKVSANNQEPQDNYEV